MKTPLQLQLFLALMLCLPFGAHATVFLQSAIQLRAEILSFLNVGLFITALISFKQFFWPGNNNTLPFQVFNMVFAGLFYGVGLPFLITNRAYYEGYENLSPIDVLGKFFLSINFSSIAQWFIVASVIINILYIIRYRKDYYEAGIASSGSDVPAKQEVDGTHLQDAKGITNQPTTDAELPTAHEEAIAFDASQSLEKNGEPDSPHRGVADNLVVDVTGEEITG